MNIKKAQSKAEQAKDTGLAITLLFLIVTYFFHFDFLIVPAIVTLVLTMTWPKIFRPLAFLWFGLSHIMGKIMSKVLLTVIFYIVVVPMASLRKIIGKDPMQRKSWKKEDGSCLTVRDHTFTAKDLEKPF